MAMKRRRKSTGRLLALFVRRDITHSRNYTRRANTRLWMEALNCGLRFEPSHPLHPLPSRIEEWITSGQLLAGISPT